MNNIQEAVDKAVDDKMRSLATAKAWRDLDMDNPDHAELVHEALSKITPPERPFIDQMFESLSNQLAEDILKLMGHKAELTIRRDCEDGLNSYYYIEVNFAEGVNRSTKGYGSLNSDLVGGLEALREGVIEGLANEASDLAKKLNS